MAVSIAITGFNTSFVCATQSTYGSRPLEVSAQRVMLHCFCSAIIDDLLENDFVNNFERLELAS